jgi:hypothetical protein
MSHVDPWRTWPPTLYTIFTSILLHTELLSLRLFATAVLVRLNYPSLPRFHQCLSDAIGHIVLGFVDAVVVEAAAKNRARFLYVCNIQRPHDAAQSHYSNASAVHCSHVECLESIVEGAEELMRVRVRRVEFGLGPELTSPDCSACDCCRCDKAGGAKKEH